MKAAGPLSGKVALVTGASRGIGAATAAALAKAGAHVVISARSADGLVAVKDGIEAGGGAATIAPLDMRDPEDIASLGRLVAERFPALDVLVANAGILGTAARIEEMAPQLWDETIAVNVTANWHLVRALHGALARSAAGRAVFITSGISWRKLPGLAAYAASKAALNALIEAYAAETRDGRLRVNLFSPGAIRTELFSTAFPDADLDAARSPEEVAERIVACCLPGVTETGKVYDFRSGRWLELRPPA